MPFVARGANRDLILIYFMAAGDDSKIQAGMLSFALKQGQQSHIGARLGELIVRNRGPIVTPNYVVPTSRGVVPHVTQDTQSKLTGIGAIYIGLEDCESMRAPLPQRLTKTLTARV